MNHSLNITLSPTDIFNITDPGQNSTGPLYHGGIATQIAFAVVAIISIVGNGLVFILLLYSRKLRNSCHSVLIWNLALVDFLTGVFVIATPAHIIREAYIHPPPGLGGQMFCKFISSELFTFWFGFTSMYILVVLAIERRYAVVRSNVHSRYFTIKKTRIILIFVWILGFILVMVNLFQVSYQKDKNPPCQWSYLPDVTLHMTVYLLLFCLRFLIPMAVIIFCYLDIWRFMRMTIQNFPNQITKQNTATYKMKTKITITCAITSIAFFLCWLPNQIYFTLANLNLLQVGVDFHFVTKLLVLLNSAINPFIYSITNPYYRQEFRKMMEQVRCYKKQKPIRGLTVSFRLPDNKS